MAVRIGVTVDAEITLHGGSETVGLVGGLGELMLSKIIEAVPAIARDLASLASHRRSLELIGP